MPGLHFIFQKKGRNGSNVLLSFEKFLKETEYFNGFTTELLLRNEAAALGLTKSYSQYPLTFFEYKHYKIWMEGKIYNRTLAHITETLPRLCGSIFNQNNLLGLTEWLQNTDGEFVVIATDTKTGNWTVFRDILGRLPLYYFHEEGNFILSRDLRFVQKCSRISDLNRISLAQFLLFGYLLRNGTFNQKIQRVEPAAFFFIETSDRITTTTLKQFNYDKKKYRYLSATRNAAQLSDIFIESCKNRSHSGTQSVVKLSGGYDSRTIAAGLKAAQSDFIADTWIGKKQKNLLDYTTAKQIAETLNVPWNNHPIRACSGNDVRTTLLLKCGLVHLGSPYPMRYASILRDIYGINVTVFDGLFGDKLMPNLRPVVPQYTLSGLVDYLLRKNMIWTPKDIESLMGVTQAELIDSVKETLLSYPEKSLNHKYVHWIIHERGMSRFFEGNDRNRSYFWIGTPFLNPIFYDYAMNCPDTQKTNRYLYTLMLKNLVPELLNVPYARNNALKPEPIAQYANKIFQLRATATRWGYIIDKGPNPMRYLYRKFNKNKHTKHQTIQTAYSQSLFECICRQAEIPEVTELFSKKQLDRVIAAPEKWRPDALSCLLTVMSVIEDFHRAETTIDRIAALEWQLD